MNKANKEDWPGLVSKAIDEHWTHIKTLNQRIHSEPELAFEEVKAHDNCVHTLTALGLPVTPHAYGVNTAFAAEYGSGGRLVIFNAEYDALPGIGHACGHNLIASAAFAAFLGVVTALKETGKAGRVRLLGTPAEEGGGGKLYLIRNGAYKGASACLMVHPGAQYLLPEGVTGVADLRMLANVKWKVYFSGKTAHAAVEPWNGVNALDAVCLSYNAISMLRQQIRPYERIHGVFREAGDRPNVVPGHTAVEYYVRSDTLASARRLWDRVKKCFEGAALATGCQVRYEELNSYADLRSSKVLCQAFVDAMPDEHVSLNGAQGLLPGSTDMGNVTYECPGFHGAFGIPAPEGQGNHTKGFTGAAALDESFDAAMKWARGMAIVGCRVLTDDTFSDELRLDWEADMRNAK